jgi:hypothetical protein
VAATFEPVGLTYTLTVGKDGAGGGAVTSDPSGIDCGSDCSEPYLSGTSVTLTASADGDSTFTGWSGACSGAGDCTVTMSAARSASATFRSNATPEVMIYDDALASAWQNWSWSATIDLAGTSPVQVGSHAVNATMNGWGAFSPAMSSGSIDTSFGYEAVKFWIHGGTGTDKAFVLSCEGDGGSSNNVGFTAVANSWTEITVTLAELGNPSSVSRLNFQNDSASSIGMATFDHIRLEPAPSFSLFADDFETGDTWAWSVTVP